MKALDRLELWRAEGTASMIRRGRHAVQMQRRRRSFGNTPTPSIEPRRLTLLATDADPKLGGVTAQCVWRWDQESRGWPSGLLYPSTRTGSWRLDLADGTRKESHQLSTSSHAATGLHDPRPVLRELDKLGMDCEDLLIDGLAGFDPVAVLDLARQRPLAVYLHDFASYCVRPHLLEQPMMRFCEFSTENSRCGRCLAHPEPGKVHDLDAHRAASAALMKEARLTAFASDFLRRTSLRALDTELDRRRHVVVHPGIPNTALPPRPPKPDNVARVAFIGGGSVHKGADAFLRLLRSRDWSRDQVQWFVVGGYGVEFLRRFRRQPHVRVLGFVRPGHLPLVLRELSIDATLHLSIVPESFSLTLSESAHASCGALATDLGAMVERLPSSSRVAPGSIRELTNKILERSFQARAQPLFVDESVERLRTSFEQG